ncbi:MAG: hypothetical protein HC890_20195, partial [Chloroflexaceae bacterium]|nr:hypothetical protein [Chloroflexaceae bacterium]
FTGESLPTAGVMPKRLDIVVNLAVLESLLQKWVYSRKRLLASCFRCPCHRPWRSSDRGASHRSSGV